MNTKTSSRMPRKLAVALGLMALSAAPAQSAMEAWVQRYSHPTDSNDYAEKVVTDNVGNVIVTGYSADAISGRDFLIIKYSGAGMPLWTNRYNGPGNGDDFGTAIAVDDGGNVFVTGQSWSGGYFDYATVAYSAAGVPLWTNRCNGPANRYDAPSAIAVDGSGNVFVTGLSVRSGDDTTDYLTVAYSGAGVPLWTNRYDGPANPAISYDEPRAMAVDSSGNVFVTGHSFASGSAYDYATVAYSGSGVPLWTNRYNGPGNGDDEPRAIAVDGRGNVFVTGYSDNADYATVAYSGAGVPLWTNHYNGPGLAWALAVDGSGNVFVTGTAYATVAYSGAGVPSWTNRYEGPAGYLAQAFAIAVDNRGNVFVTGYSRGGSYDFATVAYSGAGVPLWTNRFDGRGPGGFNDDQAAGIAVDGSGNVFVTGSVASGGFFYDFATVAYSGAGVPLWTNRYNGLGSFSDDQATAIAADGSGNVFVTGGSVASGGYSDYATVAYSGAGVPLWTNRYDGPGRFDDDQAVGIAVDGSGNVFVTGSSVGNSGFFDDYLTVAYSGAGVPLWTNRYDSFSDDRATAIAVDGSGNVFVTGSSAADYATVAYSAAGMPLWTNYYEGPAGHIDQPTAIAVARGGNVFVTGYSFAGSGSNLYAGYATVAYSGAGAPLWTNRFDGLSNYNHRATAIALDGSGNVFVTGYAGYLPIENLFSVYATVAYSGAGVPLWTNRYHGPGNSSDEARAIAVGASGNVFITGSSAADYATVAYSGAGVPLWTNRYNGPGNSSDEALAIAVDASGNVFVTGYSYGSDGSFDYATVAYSGAGVSLRTNRYDGPAGDDDQATAIAMDSSGNVFVTGRSAGLGGRYDYATIKYWSLPCVTIEGDGEGGYFIRLNGIPGSTYRLEWATNLNHSWTPSSPRTAPASGVVEFRDFFPPSNQAFYRVRVE